MAQHKAPAPKVAESQDGAQSISSIQKPLQVAPSGIKWGSNFPQREMGSVGTADTPRVGLRALTSSKVRAAAPVMHSNPKIQAQATPKKPCLTPPCQIKVLHGFRTGEFTGQWGWLLQ